ncbi:hypothetical protein AEAC466_21250 [Asticcacaulis sp. AC466]|uniref:YDG domain-containing protein n=1 Tax=Asticcacaulis sp. AC466 TaxID=1282362 RepID=UPI0003C40DDB|nr:YDG domain-containing protein [Asticcacaulis sp. AC466]ESQ81528.1 hypothetical protein AEAC466_21250 [Asticcacaulis sp. AC466]
MYDHGGMNRFYRLVWSDAKGCYIPIPEVSQKRGKRKGGLFAALAAAAIALLSAATGALADPGTPVMGTPVIQPTPVMRGAEPQTVAPTALPTGGQVVGGQATISQSGNTQTITQTSQNAAIDWQSFNIGADGKVIFNQPNASAVALNRVLGGDASKIYGVLQANGQVFLVNPNGVLFAKGSQVSAAAVMASTRDMSVADFMAGKYRLAGTGSGAIVNEGTITAGAGGFVALVGAQVVNDGAINAAQGDVRLIAANDVTIRLDTGGLDLTINQGAYDALVANGGVIKADSGRIYLTADAFDALAKSSVNNTGIIEASSLATVGGKVVLSGDTITLADGSQINATGATGGGTVLVGGGWQGKDASIRNASTVLMAPDATIDVSAMQSGKGGTAVLWSEDRTGFYGTITAKGGMASGNGGQVETSGHTQLQAVGAVDASAANGEAGQWLLDPVDVTIATSGANGTAYSANYNPNADSTILASAINSSLNGGTSVTITTGSTGSSAGNITVNANILKSNGNAATLSLQAAGDIVVNNQISSTANRLNVVLTADSDNSGSGSILFGAGGKVLTNGGNFYAGSLASNVNSKRGQNFTMAAGSQIDVGTGGFFDIAVNGTVSLDANSLIFRQATYPVYYNDGTNSQRSAYFSVNAGSIVSTNTSASTADIITRVGLNLNAATGDIGASSNALKISAGDPASGMAYGGLSISNSGGSTWVNEIETQSTASINLSIGSQTNSQHHINIMNDAGNGNGHIDLTTDGAGVVQVANNGIRTGGNFDWNAYEGIYPTDLTLSAGTIHFASGAVDSGTASLTVNATTMTGSNDGVADIVGRSIRLNGSDIGTSANPLELADNNHDEGFWSGSLTVNNNGGSTYLKVLNDGFGYLSLDNVKAAGSHSILFSGGDHIDFTTDGSSILTPTVSGGASDGTTFGATTGIDLSRSFRNLTLSAADGNILLGDDSIRMNAGMLYYGEYLNTMLTLGIDRYNATGVIAAQNSYNSGSPAAQITAGDVSLSVGNDLTPAATTIGAGGKDIQIAKAAGAGNGALNVSTYQGDVSIHELTENHFKSVSVSLGDVSASQTIAIDLKGADDINFSDNGSQLLVDATKVAVSSNNRTFSLSAGARTIQADGNSLTTGGYTLSGKYLKLNGDIVTDGGNISLYGSYGVNLLSSVLVDSNSGHLGVGGTINISSSSSYSGSISATGSGKTLMLDSHSTNDVGGNIGLGDMVDNRAGAYLAGLAMNATSVGTGQDASINVSAKSVLLDGTFSAYGATSVGYYNSDFLLKTAASNSGSAGNILFGGDSLSHGSSYAATFNASTTATNGNGGAVDLFTSDSAGVFQATTLSVTASAGSGGTKGAIELGGVSTSSSQTYSGSTITLNGDLTTSNATLSLGGPAYLNKSVTIKSGSGAMTVGTLSATAAGLNATIGSASDSGSLSLSADNAAGHYVDTLTVLSQGARAVTLAGIATEGTQTYTGGQLNFAGALSTNGGNINLSGASNIATSSPITFTTDRTGGTNDAGRVLLGSQQLKGSGALTIDTTADGGGANAALVLNDAGNSTAFSSINIKAGSVTLNGTVKSTGNITIEALGAGSDLSIASTGKVQTTGTSNTIVLAAGRNFLNSAASNTGITYGAGSRYLVYSADPAASTEGMTGYSKHYNQAYSTGVTPSYAGSGNWFLYSIAPVISVSSNASSVVYGSADPSLTLGASNYSGFIDGDSFASLSGSQTLSLAAPGTLSSAGKRQVGTYAYTLNGTVTDSLGYQYAVFSEDLAVTKASITVTGLTAVNRQYDGTTGIALTGTAQAGAAQSGDQVTVDVSGITGSITDKNVGTNKSVIISGSGGLTGADAGNYQLAPPTGLTVDVTQKTLTIAGSSVTGKTYDGTRTASVTSGTLSGMIGSETLSVSASGLFSDKAAGTAKSVATTYTLADGTGLASNYSLAGETLYGDIAKKAITIAATGQDKTYDGSDGIVVSVSSADIFQGDTVSFTGTGTASDKNAGTGKTVSVSGIAASGADADNYDFGTTASTTANIAKKSIAVTATGQNKTYDGSDSVGVSLASSDVINGDVVSFSGTGTASDKNAGTGKTVSVSAIAAAGTDAGNYDYNTTASATANIAKKTISLAATGQNRTYDGSAAVGVTVASSDLVQGDTVSFSGNGAMADKNAGTGKSVAVTAIAATGADAGNYDYASTASTTVDVAKRAITVAAAGQNKTYDGTTAVGVTLGSTDILNGDTVGFTGTGALTDKNAGTGKTVAVSAIAASGADADNYVFGSTATTTADVAKKAITIAAAGQNKTYDGSASVGVNLASNDVINGDQVSFTGTGTASDKNAGTNKTVAISNFAATGADAANYDYSAPTSATVDIAKKAITIAATGQNKTYDGSASVGVNLASNDVINGDQVSFNGTGTASDKNAGTNKTVAISNFAATGADAANYDYSAPTSATVDIAKKAITIAATGQNKTYDGSASVGVNLASNDVINGDQVVFSGTGEASDKNAGTGKAVTIGNITASGADAGNYAYVATGATTVDIAKKAVTIAATGQNKTYDGSASVGLDLTSGGLVSGDQVAFSGAGVASDKNAGTGKTVAVTNINASGADAGNYTYNTQGSTTVDIARKAIDVAAAGVAKTYDGSTGIAVNLSSGDIVAGDQVAFTGTGTASDKNAGAGKAVAVTGINASGADADNYAYSTTGTTTVDIAQKTVTLTVGAQGKTYDGSAAVAVTLASNGIVAGDRVAFTGTGTASDKNAGTGKTVAVTGINASGVDAGNYAYATNASTTVDIATRAFDVALQGPISKTGDGSTAVTLTTDNYKLSGLVAGESITVNQTAGQFADATAGKDKTVTAQLASTNYVAGANTDLSNYKLISLTLTTNVGEIVNPTSPGYDSALTTATSNPVAGTPGTTFTTPVGTSGPAVSTGDGSNAVATVSDGGQSGQSTSLAPVESRDGLTFRRTFSIADGGIRLPDGVADAEGGRKDDGAK